MDSSILMCGLGTLLGSYINIFIIPILKDFCKLYPLYKDENYDGWCEGG